MSIGIYRESAYKQAIVTEYKAKLPLIGKYAKAFAYDFGWICLYTNMSRVLAIGCLHYKKKFTKNN